MCVYERREQTETDTQIDRDWGKSMCYRCGIHDTLVWIPKLQQDLPNTVFSQLWVWVTWNYTRLCLMRMTSTGCEVACEFVRLCVPARGVRDLWQVLSQSGVPHSQQNTSTKWGQSGAESARADISKLSAVLQWMQQTYLRIHYLILGTYIYQLYTGENDKVCYFSCISCRHVDAEEENTGSCL